MRSWYDEGGRVACLGELDGDTLVLQPAQALQDALVRVWIPTPYVRRHPQVVLGRPQWPVVRDLLPASLVTHVDAERPEWATWVERERGWQALRPADPLAQVAQTPPPSVSPDHPWHRLYPFQRTGVRWAFSVGQRAIIGDDMGLGKTPQGWMVLELDPAARRALIVCPGSVLVNWTREGKAWAPSWTSSVAWSSQELRALAERPYPDRHATVVSWGLLSRSSTVLSLRAIGFDAVVLDEAHYAKNPEAARTQSVLRLLHDARIRLPLSGTPIKSRPAEFWTLLHGVDPLRFHTFYPFGETFCGAKDRRIGLRTVRVYTGNARLPRLAKLTTPYVLRREKGEVLTELPPKSRQTLPLRGPKALEAKSVDLLHRLREQARAGMDDPRALGEIQNLRKEIGLAKVEAAVEWATSAHEAGEPSVLFVYHQEVAAEIVARLERAGLRVGTILGSTPGKLRQPLVDAFARGELDVFVGSEAIKEGVSLVRAALSCQVEYWWTPGDMEQAEDRLWRNRQLRRVLNVYLHLEGTLDDHMALSVEGKREVVRETLVRDGFHKGLLARLSTAPSSPLEIG